MTSILVSITIFVVDIVQQKVYTYIQRFSCFGVQRLAIAVDKHPSECPFCSLLSVATMLDQLPLKRAPSVLVFSRPITLAHVDIC